MEQPKLNIKTNFRPINYFDRSKKQTNTEQKYLGKNPRKKHDNVNANIQPKLLMLSSRNNILQTLSNYFFLNSINALSQSNSPQICGTKPSRFFTTIETIASSPSIKLILPLNK
uniref:Uncharacterized protein n=1 Tax=Solanum lycopersicum TaxID=4081 RepID=A0A3Q7FD44_SOLLC